MATTTLPTVMETPAGPHSPVRLGDGFPFAVKVFAAVWVGWALLGLLASTVDPGGKPLGVPGLDAEPLSDGWHNLLDSGRRADAYWYERIAIDGYRAADGSAAFFPLFPALIRVTFTAFHIAPHVAAFAVAQSCFLAALTVLYALTLREFGATVARHTTAYLAIFPTAFFLLAPYAESLLLLLTLLTFWFARAGLWGRAALFAAAAALTRSAGLMIAFALAAEAIVRRRRAREPIAPGLAAAGAPLVAFALLVAFWAIAGGDAFAPMRAQERWGREPSFPLVTLYHGVETAFQLRGYWMIDLLVVAVAGASIVLAARWIPFSYTVLAVACFLLPLCAAWPTRPLMSVPRFVVVIFPVFWGIALMTARRRLPHSLVVAGFAGGYAVLGMMFVRSYAIF